MEQGFPKSDDQPKEITLVTNVINEYRAVVAKEDWKQEKHANGTEISFVPILEPFPNNLKL